MSTYLIPAPVQRFVDSNGNALSGGFLYTYAAGTSTPLATYTDSTGTVANTNPIVLNSRGECAYYLTGGVAYKLVLQDSSNVTIWTADNLRAPTTFQSPELPLGSATTTDIGGQNTNYLQITGTTTITSFGSNFNGPIFLRFAGALTLTNSSTLVLPGGANITTAAGDTCIAIPIGNPSTGWAVVSYQRAGYSMVRVNTANGLGSTNTAIRRFTTTVTTLGADVTYADSATNGASFTINNAGMYAISYTDGFSATNPLGLSINSAQLTTAITGITAANRLSVATAPGANLVATAAWTGYLAAGDVIRPHSVAGVVTGSPDNAQFTIARVA